MIALLDTSHDLKECERELGCRVEQLITPLTRFLPQYPSEHFAIENGAFSKKGFNAKGFRSLLEREEPRKKLCRYVSVPDVPMSARRTLEVFEHWSKELNHWPLALVAQDGQEDLPLPWEEIAAVFIGGSTEWKLGRHAAAVIRAGKALGKWVHVGRVNMPGKFEYFEHLGADSIDGTGLAQYSYMREAIYNAKTRPQLFASEERQGSLCV